MFCEGASPLRVYWRGVLNCRDVWSHVSYSEIARAWPGVLAVRPIARAASAYCFVETCRDTSL